MLRQLLLLAVVICCVLSSVIQNDAPAPDAHHEDQAHPKAEEIHGNGDAGEHGNDHGNESPADADHHDDDHADKKKSHYDKAICKLEKEILALEASIAHQDVVIAKQNTEIQKQNTFLAKKEKMAEDMKAEIHEIEEKLAKLSHEEEEDHIEWMEHHGHHCFFNETEVDWKEALDACHHIHAELAEPRDDDLEAFLEAESQKHGKQYWLGGFDFIHEGSWHWWSDNHVIQYTDWHDGHPNNADGAHVDNCILDNWHGSGKWVDAHCDLKKPFICCKD